MTNEELAFEIAKGIVATGVEGGYDSVSCSSAGDYPSIGVSQWEGARADEILRRIGDGWDFIDRTYSDIKESGELYDLKAILNSEEGQKVQLEQLTADCLELYVPSLKKVENLDDSRCFIYAGIWCPTSHWVVYKFLYNRQYDYNIRSLYGLSNLFKRQYYIAADVGSEYYEGYANRAQTTYEYVAAIDLTTPYGVPPYGEAGNGR